MYNPQAPQGLSQPPPRAGAYAYGRPPMTQPQSHPQQPSTLRQPQQIPQHPQHPLQHSQPLGPPPPQPQQMTQASHAYIQEQHRRQSMPPAFPQHERQVPEQGDKSSLQIRIKTDLSQSPPQKLEPNTQCRGIYTPIDDRKSILAKQFGFGPTAESPKAETPLKSEAETPELPAKTVPAPPPHSRSHPLPVKGRVLPDPQSQQSQPQRTQSLSSVPSSRNSSLRPQLSLQIPSEQSDTSVTANSTSPKDSGNTVATPAKGSSDPGHSAVVLPAPSPSASAILSAGAHGPPNPFARPAVPITAGQNNASLNANNHGNVETPISALPSRFVSDTLLPSPSSFYPEWGFGRSGPDSNMLPSPLTFPTPVMQSGPGFSKDPPPDEMSKKRKTPDAPLNSAEPVSTGKRLRVE